MSSVCLQGLQASVKYISLKQTHKSLEFGNKSYLSICCVIPNLGSVHHVKGTKKKDRKWLFCCMSEAQKINETSEYCEQVNTSSCY